MSKCVQGEVRIARLRGRGEEAVHSTSVPPEIAGPVLLYDGTCGFCAASVAFILRHERQHFLRFASLEGPLGAQVRGRHPELRGIASMVWVSSPGLQQERVLVRSAAALRVATYLGGPWRLAAAGRLLPTRLRDLAYDWIAHHRHSLMPSSEQCFLPAPAVRFRFLDQEQEVDGDV